MSAATAQDIVQDARKHGRRIALVVTALDLELQAVLAHVTKVTSAKGRDGTIYECGVFSDGGDEWQIIILETGAGNHPANNAVTNAHVDFGPEIQFFVGVAGSRKSDVPIGSVVAADHVYNPYGGKAGEHGFSARPREFPTNPRLLEIARKVKRDKKWIARIRDLADLKLPGFDAYPCNFPPIAAIAPAVSTEAVLADKTSNLEALIAQHYGDACVVEMEGFGAIYAASREEKPAIVIRGVSDMAEHKDPVTDKIRQPVAAAHAAAFAFELLGQWSSFYPSSAPASPSAPGPGTAPLPRESAQPPGPSITAKSTRYVLNIDADKRTVSAERIAQIEQLLRELAGDDALIIERIDEGSLRLTVRDPSGRIEHIGVAKLRTALNDRLSLHLLGLVAQHSLEELGDIAEELKAASGDLTYWPDTLPDGEQLERSELADLLQVANGRLSSTTAVIGEPGSGKSALLAMMCKRLAELGHPYLAIKADLLDTNVSNEADLREHLGLSDRPSALLTRIAEFRPVFLLIDQLDALAGYLDLRTGRLSALLNLVRRLGQTDNIHIILSARKFEYEHDVRLRSISAESIELQLPGWSQVLPLLEKHGTAAAGWPADAQQVLRSPQALATFLQLDESLRSEAFSSYQALLHRLWDQRVIKGENGPRRSHVAMELADLMAEEESLWLPLARFDDWREDIQYLMGVGILSANTAGTSVGFAHQTVFDFALARAFAADRGKLSAFVLERQASLFLRPKLWAALTYLRDADPLGYGEEVRTIWKEEGLRRHLRLLVLEFLGQQKTPTDNEAELLMEAFQIDTDRALAFRAIAGSPGWFSRFEQTVISQAMKEHGPARDWVGRVLSAALEFAPDQVATLIERYWLPDSEDDYRSWLVIQQAQDWDDRMLQIGQTIVRRTQIAPHYVEQAAGSIGVNRPRAGVELIRAALDRSLDLALSEAERLASVEPPELEREDLRWWRINNDPARPIKNLLETSNEWDTLGSLAERSPYDTLQIMWPWFVRALKAMSDLQSGNLVRPIYPLQFDADFRFEGENRLDLPEPSIPAALRIAAEKLASENVDLFRAWMSEARNDAYHPAQRLIAHALGSHPEPLAEDALAYLLEDPRRLSLGHIEDYCGTTARLVSSIAPYWSRSQIQAFEGYVWNYSPPVPHDLQDADGRRAWSRLTRKRRLQLLRALPEKQRTSAVAERVRTEQRAIGDGRLGVTFSGAYSPAAIMRAADMERAKDQDILNAFREVPDATGWNHPSGDHRGGNIQLAREFATFAKSNRERAMGLISAFEPSFGERAAGYALREMDTAVNPQELQSVVVDLANRGFNGPEFQSSVATVAEHILNRDIPLEASFVETLRTWLEAQDESNSPGDTANNADSADNEDGGDRSSASEDSSDALSLLWGYGGMSILPSGPFPLLHALARHFLVAGDDCGLRELLNQNVERRLGARVWEHMLPLLYYLPAGSDGAAAWREILVERLVAMHPSLRSSKDFTLLLGHMHWWAVDYVERELALWPGSSSRAVRYGYGELVSLLALIHPERDWPQTALNSIETGDNAEARAGAATTAVHLWGDGRHRGRSTTLLVRLLPNAGDLEWKAIVDLFRVNDVLPPDENTALLLEALTTHVEAAPKVDATFVIDRLQGLLPHDAQLVSALSLALAKKWQSELGDLRTGTAAHASDLVDLAVTLHRLGPATREDGTRLFEILIEIDAYMARETLAEIDNRFRPNAAPIRPRLPRRRRAPRRSRSE